MASSLTEKTTIASNDKVDDEEVSFEHFVLAQQIIQSSTVPIVLKAVSELGVFSIIAQAGEDCLLSAKEIANRLQAVGRNPDAPLMLDRMLGLLATHSIVTCSVVTARVGDRFERRYGLAPLSKWFVPDESGVSLSPFLSLIEDDVVRSSWSKLKDATVGGGIPFNMVHGVGAFEYPSLDQRFNDVYNKAMFNYTTIIMKKILQKYKGFEGIKQLVDVGGGIGHTLHAISSKYPSIRGVNFDLPHVISNAPSYPGVDHVSGDMFECVPQGEAIIMKWLLHNWTDDYCVKLLKNCYKALPENGKVIVMESVVSEEPETTITAKAVSQLDVYLMSKNPGGKERTQKEFHALAIAAGFAGTRVDCFVCHFCIMEFHK